MARNVTVTFSDGTQHVYQNVPDDVTPDQVQQRASSEYSDRTITSLDGGRAATSSTPDYRSKPKDERLVEAEKQYNQAFNDAGFLQKYYQVGMTDQQRAARENLLNTQASVENKGPAAPVMSALGGFTSRVAQPMIGATQFLTGGRLGSQLAKDLEANTNQLQADNPNDYAAGAVLGEGAKALLPIGAGMGLIKGGAALGAGSGLLTPNTKDQTGLDYYLTQGQQGIQGAGIGAATGGVLKGAIAAPAAARATKEFVKEAPGQIRAGYDVARHGIGESAYGPVDPAVLKLAEQQQVITPRQAQIIAKTNTLPKEGKGIQAWAENLVGGYINKPIQELAFDVLPSLATGTPIPGGAIKEGIKAAADARLASKIRATESPNIVKTDTGLLGGGTGSGGPTGTVTLPVSPSPLAQAEAEAANKQRIAQTAQTMPQIRNKSPEELAQEAVAAKQAEQAAIKEQAEKEAKAASSQSILEQIRSRGPQINNQAPAPVTPDQLEKWKAAGVKFPQTQTNEVATQPARVLTSDEKLEQMRERLKQQQPVNPAELFEGDLNQKLTRAELADMNRAQKAAEARMAGEIDESDLGKVYTEAEIARKYEAYKNAKPGARKDKLKREYDAMENSRSDRGLNAGGNNNVLGMLTAEQDKMWNALKQPDNVSEIELKIANMSQKARDQMKQVVQSNINEWNRGRDDYVIKQLEEVIDIINKYDNR